MFRSLKPLPKTPTGIRGLDEILDGGLPQGRPTLLCGTAGTGKTLLGMEFLVHGATLFDEPGVFMSFEETEDELVQNMASLGFDLPDLIANKKLLADFVHIAQEEIRETGEYNLEGLFVRLGYAIDSIGAKRVVLDTVETLFPSLSDLHILRTELQRLFRWFKDKGVTAVITSERGEQGLTRHGLEEYVSDCVILLDHRVAEQVSTRHLRVIKYRGSTHGTNEYPFLIDEQGITIMPITSLGLNYPAFTKRVSSGIPSLDTMLGGKGFYRGSTLLVSGTAGTGKTSIAAHFAEAACKRGEKVLFFAFEESPRQIMRNMCSIGIDLRPHLDKEQLRFEATRPTMYGLEEHLAKMYKNIDEFQPEIVVIDPINAFVTINNEFEVKFMLTRLSDFLKKEGITAMFTSLTAGGSVLERTNTAISSLIDTWLLLVDTESNGERNKLLYILKSRGMAHSNQVHKFLITGQGIDLVNIKPDRIPAGLARIESEAGKKAARSERQQKTERRRRMLERKRQALETKIATLREAFSKKEVELIQLIAQKQKQEACLLQDRVAEAKSRCHTQNQSGNMEMADPNIKPEKMNQRQPYKPAEIWNLRLYVAGQTPKSLAAFANLKTICEKYLQGRYTMEVVDLLENPQLAKGDQILAIPTLVRKLPPPLRKIIGSLSNTERVLVGLDLKPNDPEN